ncbi:7-carboxy-7-deazaguanine synthase [Myxococcota bacterium]|nr:7-carboxy-7-deazaguanine synthase [Myxococcota bacterium]MBU1432212.1 7-carboxy-7-deazaguanine synthase [Myxococcota bacterium]MBU1900417.1 7-carboxy-7-deazaguanine synthase [Myxococcota bacterium]
MSYQVKEIFLTLQGEGGQAGRAAVFCRFAGCNLWTGREADRAHAICRFCDTDFLGVDGPGGGRFEGASALADALEAAWGARGGEPFVVFTGGEPTLQLDAPLLSAVKARGFYIAVETNGTRPTPQGVDWICVSPKPNTTLAQTHGQELKLVYPVEGLDPRQFEALSFERFFLQPLDDAQQAAHIQAAARRCLESPQWRLSLQTHKLIGIP